MEIIFLGRHVHCLTSDMPGLVLTTSAAHAKCIMAGGKKVKVGEPTVTCTNLGMNCTAKARACK